MSSLLMPAESIICDVDCKFIEKEVDMGFFKNFFEDNGIMYSKCPCKCTCDCDRCGAWFS